ncbi:metallophosphoesterase family protein [Companilactobacillus halodurans]|uniref:Metallophosphoesterase n=1 Tax=Companilactobacillus halodurans TaxID=2584183 RepID=A0A5P0ZMG4_9LACO|nr:metallophosphoesterase [Companilactobacillus halodurans]MQS75372.1 metallophosphoesterase [Companilactobacillus halodurans]MQS97316.1 metallophosphoesterase [Companilactobacillus halodurans]
MSKYKVIQITDTHLTPRGKEASNNQQIDPYLKLNSIFTDISTMPEKPDMIAITGDLIHEGTVIDYVDLRELVEKAEAELKIPINVVLGNHDRLEEFFEGYVQQPSREKYYYLKETPEMNFYFLDSKFHNDEPGYLGEEQLAWLKNNLAKYSDKKSFIFLHHPVDGPGIHHMRYSILQESDELMQVITDTSVQAVFSGHIHFETSFVKAGILMHSTDSSAYHINCDNKNKHLIYDATYYDIITIEDGGIETETRCLYEGQDIINDVDVDDTGFVKDRTTN